MKQLAFILFTILIFGCSQNRTANNLAKPTKANSTYKLSSTQAEINSNQKTHLITSNHKIDLDNILKQDDNEYLTSINDSTISLCCYQIINIIPSIDFSQFKKTTEKYQIENQTKTVDVYYFEKSFVKEFYNDHPDVKHKDLVCGRIDNKNLIINDLIQIGMSKNQFFDNFFLPTILFNKINRLDVYENELGESFTSYRFLNDTLKEIVFNSDYDWIDKKIQIELLPTGR